MYPELERNNDDPMIKCPICGLGMDIFTEYNGDEDYTIVCLKCKATLEVRQTITRHYEIIKQ